MVKNKNSSFTYSIFLFVLGLIISILEGNYLDNYDKYHWLILAPIALPLAGCYFSVRSMIKASHYWKLAAILLLLANLALATVIFFAFSFSYWQF